MPHEQAIERAAALIRSARSLIITAGAGMGVDSGLPDFRGPRGFWQAYPPYERLGISFIEAANPDHFRRDPAFGWGFYGHRANLYRDTVPHDGFRILREWIARHALRAFVVTSNVDGQFQNAGFREEEILEVHGSIHYLQCSLPCSPAIWENREDVPVDPDTMRALHIPRCIRCGAVARPCILMFGDGSWISDRTARQERLFERFLTDMDDPAVVVEMGAGTAVPTIRNLGERLAGSRGAAIIRINPREPRISPPHIALPCGALEGLRAIDGVLKG